MPPLIKTLIAFSKRLQQIGTDNTIVFYLSTIKSQTATPSEATIILRFLKLLK